MCAECTLEHARKCEKNPVEPLRYEKSPGSTALNIPETGGKVPVLNIGHCNAGDEQ